MIKGFITKEQRKNIFQMRPAIAFIKRSLYNHSHSDLTGAEVGVFKARNAENILQNLNIKKLYLIDSYVAYPEYLDSTLPALKEAVKIAAKRLAPYEDKIVWIREFSDKAVKKIPDNLDFVYIDANHSYDFAKHDIKDYWPKIRTGGVLSGHDYYNILPPAPRPRRVKRAVDEFAAKNKLKVYSEGIDWWIVK